MVVQSIINMAEVICNKISIFDYSYGLFAFTFAENISLGGSTQD